MSSGAPVELGTPIRQPATALLCVDSADAARYVGKDGNPQKYITGGFRIDDNTPAEIQINKQSPLLFGYMTRLSLTEIQMEWSTPNVNARNNTLTLVVSDKIEGEESFFCRIAITENFYLPDELAAAIEVQLDTLFAGATWGVSYDTRKNSFKIEVTSTSPETNDYYFSLLPPGIGYTITNTAAPAGIVVPTGIVQDDLTFPMGFTVPYNYFTSTNPASDPGGVSLSIIGGYAPMCYTPYVDIVSNIMTKNQNIQDNDTTLRNGTAKLARVYLSNENIDSCFDTDELGAISKCNIVGCRPFAFRREFKTPKVIQWNTTENVDIIDLQVVDRLGFPIYIEPLLRRSTSIVGAEDKFGNTANFQFTIQASEI